MNTVNALPSDQQLQPYRYQVYRQQRAGNYTIGFWSTLNTIHSRIVIRG